MQHSVKEEDPSQQTSQRVPKHQGIQKAQSVQPSHKAQSTQEEKEEVQQLAQHNQKHPALMLPQAPTTEELLKKPWFSGTNKGFVIILVGLFLVILLGVIFMVIGRMAFGRIF